MRRSRGIFPVVSLLTLIAVLAAACSTDQATATGSFTDRLDLIPASAIAEPDSLIVAMADLDRAAQMAGVERPPDTTDVDAVVEYVNAIAGFRGLDAEEPATVAALMPQAASVERVSQADEFSEEVGWSIVDVSWFVESQDPLNALMVAGGDFDESRLTDAMGDREDAIWRVGGDDGEIDVTSVSAARPFGQPLRLALDDGRLLVSRTTPVLEDALAGGGRTLASNAVLRALAEAMDQEDAYSALFNASGYHNFDPSAVFLNSEATPSEALADLNNQVLPQPFRGVAGGLTSDDGEAITVLAYVHDSATAAEANADALRRLIDEGHMLQTDEPWSSVFTVDDIRTDGSTLVARLGWGERGNPQLAYNLLMNRESLVTHR